VPTPAGRNRSGRRPWRHAGPPGRPGCCPCPVLWSIHRLHVLQPRPLGSGPHHSPDVPPAEAPGPVGAEVQGVAVEVELPHLEIRRELHPGPVGPPVTHPLDPKPLGGVAPGPEGTEVHLGSGRADAGHRHGGLELGRVENGGGTGRSPASPSPRRRGYACGDPGHRRDRHQCRCRLPRNLQGWRSPLAEGPGRLGAGVRGLHVAEGRARAVSRDSPSNGSVPARICSPGCSDDRCCPLFQGFDQELR